MLRQPIALIHRNVVFGARPDDAWAVYRLTPRRAEAATRTDGARAIRPSLATLTATLRTDFSLLSIARAWDVERYELDVLAASDVRHVRRATLKDHLARQRGALDDLGTLVRDVYLSIRLGGRPGLSHEDRVTEAFADQCTLHGHILGLLDAEPASSDELRWLIRRAFRRGLNEADVGPRPQSRAVVVGVPPLPVAARARAPVTGTGSECGGALRLNGNTLWVETDAGKSHQTFLCLRTIPGEAPSVRRAILAPLASLPFPVDAAVCVHGQLETLRATISLAIGARSGPELEACVAELRREYSGVILTRPQRGQTGLFLSHLPGHRPLSAKYEQRITSAQLASVISATARAMQERTGPCVGYTLSRVPRPVMFDPAATHDKRDPQVTLLTGPRRSGKTLCMQLIMYQAFLSGRSIIDVDTRGDHSLHTLPGTRDHAEVIDVFVEDGIHGILDPLRIAPPRLREQLACELLLSLLSTQPSATTQEQIRKAVRNVIAGTHSSCERVIDVLEHGSPAARKAARELASYRTSSIGRLVVAEPQISARRVPVRPLTIFRTGPLTGPDSGARGTQLIPAPALAHAVMRLLVVYAGWTAQHRPAGHVVLGIDDTGTLPLDSRDRGMSKLFGQVRQSSNVSLLLAMESPAFDRTADSSASSTFRFGATHNLPGSCLIGDRRGRASLVRIDPLDPDLLAALTVSRGPDQTAAPRSSRTGT